MDRKINTLSYVKFKNKIKFKKIKTKKKRKKKENKHSPKAFSV